MEIHWHPLSQQTQVYRVNQHLFLLGEGDSVRLVLWCLDELCEFFRGQAFLVHHVEGTACWAPLQGTDGEPVSLPMWITPDVIRGRRIA